jgi:hypothetical protein
VAEAEQLDLGQRGGRGGARPRVEQREFADQLAGSDDGQHVLAAVGGGAVQFDLALGDDVQPVAGVALVEERVAAREGHLTHGGA